MVILHVIYTCIFDCRQYCRRLSRIYQNRIYRILPYFTAVTEAPALFEAIGYSVPEDIDKGGIVIGYIVNHSAVAEYEKNTGKTVNYGVYAVAQDKLGENDIFDENGNVADGVVDAKVEKNAYVSFEFKIVGFNDDTKDEKLALGAYVAVTKDKVTEYSYIQLGTPAEGAKYAFTSYTEYLASLS